MLNCWVVLAAIIEEPTGSAGVLKDVSCVLPMDAAKVKMPDCWDIVVINSRAGDVTRLDDCDHVFQPRIA